MIIKMNKKKVLVIDDEDFIRELVREFLELSEIQCKEAAGWERALELVAEEEFHLILLDRNLGNLRTDNFITRIKEIDKDIPIIILTGDPQCDKKYLKEVGADGIIFKPFQVDEFINHINKFLEKKN